MNIYNIEFDRKVKKDLKNIPPVIIKKIKEEIAKLADDPYPLGHKKLKGNLKDFVRIRFGDYRIIYQVENEKLVILVIRIGHRQNVYK